MFEGRFPRGSTFGCGKRRSRTLHPTMRGKCRCGHERRHRRGIRNPLECTRPTLQDRDDVSRSQHAMQPATRVPPRQTYEGCAREREGDDQRFVDGVSDGRRSQRRGHDEDDPIEDASVAAIIRGERIHDGSVAYGRKPQGQAATASTAQKREGPATPAFRYRCSLPVLAGFTVRCRQTHITCQSPDRSERKTFRFIAFTVRLRCNGAFVTHPIGSVERRDQKIAERAGLSGKIHTTLRFSIARTTRAW